MTEDGNTKTPLQLAKEAESAAYSELRKLERGRDDEISAAKDRIRDEWNDRIAGAQLAYHDARTVTKEAETAAAVDHEWEGKVVRRELRRRYGDKGPRYERGVVITYRPGVSLPANIGSYRKPAIGQPIIRLLKQNGEPGVLFERMTESWQLEPSK